MKCLFSFLRHFKFVVKLIFIISFINGITIQAYGQKNKLPKKDIRAARIDSIFDQADANSLDIRGVLRYEYSFTNPSQDQLQKLSVKLRKDSFETIALKVIGDKRWQLVVMKNQILTRQTMEETDKKMRSLAYQFLVDKYTGFSISKFQVNPLKVTADKFGSYIKSLDNEALFKAATYLISQKSYDRSMVAFQESIDRHYKEDTAQFQMGNALVATNEFVKGIERWENARNLNHHYLDAYLKLGDIFMENSHFNRALYNYQEADTLKPNDDVILYKIASDLIELKRYNESYKYAKRSVKLNRKNIYAKGLIEILKQPAIRKLRKKYPDL